MLWPLTVVLVANTNGRLAIPALAGLLVTALWSLVSTLGGQHSPASVSEMTYNVSSGTLKHTIPYPASVLPCWLPALKPRISK